jgi:hypothetical protein
MFQYVLPAFFGLFIAFGLVHVSHTGDMRGLMASVSTITQPQYDADIIIERDGDILRIIMGKTAEKVDHVTFRFLSNPADALNFSTITGTITDETEGTYLYVRSYNGQDISVGTVIAEFT